MKLEFTNAFAPFMDETAVFRGVRKTETTERTFEFSTDCCVFSGQPADQISVSSTPTGAVLFSIIVPKSGWKDAEIPQAGDRVTIDGYPEMSVCSGITGNHSFWKIPARSRERQTI